MRLSSQAFDDEVTGDVVIGELVRVSSVQALQETAADVFTAAAADAVTRRGRFMVALAGGKTPEGTYELLGSDPRRSAIQWSRVHCFFGDERHVPPDHADSNFGMARRALLDRVPIDPHHVWRMKTEDPDARRAAAAYEADLRTGFAIGDDDVPRFDLILLGLGADGHTASLFPHTGALRERERLVVANRVEALATERITLTLPVLNNAIDTVFLVHGGDKAPALRAVLEGPPDPETYPAQLIRPSDGRLRWLVTPDAVRLLPASPR